MQRSRIKSRRCTPPGTEHLRKLSDSISKIPRSNDRLCFHLCIWKPLKSRDGQESNPEPAVLFPRSDSLALRGVACWPGNRSVRRRLRNHHSLHVPPVPPPLRLRTLEPPLNSASGQGDRHQPRPRCSRRSVGGKALTRGPSLNAALSKLTAKLAPKLAAVRSGAQPECSARPAARARCAGSRTGPARPHGAAVRPAPPRPAWPARPSSPPCVSLRPRPRLPAPALVSPAPRLPDSVRAARGRPAPGQKRRPARLPAPGATQTGVRPGARRAPFEELARLRGTVWGLCLNIELLLLQGGISLNVPC